LVGHRPANCLPDCLTEPLTFIVVARWLLLLGDRLTEMSATEERIKVLDTLPLDELYPEASGPTLPIALESSWFDVNFRDSLAYETRWSEETKQLIDMVWPMP